MIRSNNETRFQGQESCIEQVHSSAIGCITFCSDAHISPNHTAANPKGTDLMWKHSGQPARNDAQQ